MKIQENFTNMRQGINQTKTQLSEWVLQAARQQQPPPLPSGDEPLEASAPDKKPDSATSDVEIIDKKDPILLALEKENQAFDPDVYLRKSEATEGSESLWLMTDVYYQTRMDMIRGQMTFKLDHLTFEAYTRKLDVSDEHSMGH